MNTPRSAIVWGLVTLGIALACFGDPPEFGQSEESIEIQQLRREFDDLKQTVHFLRNRLNELE